MYLRSELYYFLLLISGLFNSSSVLPIGISLLLTSLFVYYSGRQLSQPTVTDSQPTVTDSQPTVTDSQPTVIDLQPTVTDSQPTDSYRNLPTPIATYRNLLQPTFDNYYKTCQRIWTFVIISLTLVIYFEYSSLIMDTRHQF